jgi:hypothetical protein
VNRILKQAIAAACLVICTHNSSEAQLQSGNLSLSREAIVRFNRVEGLFTGYDVRVRPTSARHVTAHVSGGYGIHNGQGRWDAGLEIDKSKWTIGANLFDRTVSPNESIIRTSENTIFALLFKGDYLDYFRARNGFEVSSRYKWSRYLSMIGYLSAFQYHNMPVDINWTVFRNSDTFRSNPTIREGDAAVVKLGFAYNNRRKSPIFRNAWFVSLLYERGFREFPYNGIALSFKRYQKTIFGKQAFVLRGLLGSRESVDEQHQYDLGGVGTLRGYRIKEYSGNRVMLFGADYLFRGDLISKVSSRMGQFVELIAFADAGWVDQVPKTASLLDGFDALRFGDIKTNVGAALSLYRQLIRVNAARRFDSDIDDWTFSVRFRREF